MKKNYWMLGAAFNGSSQDQTERFLREGIWEIYRPSDTDRKKVMLMKSGDQIAIKSSFVKIHDLPFENHGITVSVMRLKARGTITSNPGTGERVYVEWDTGFSPKEWYFYTYRSTIWLLKQGKETADRLIKFAFDDALQDYKWFLSHSFWRDKYQPKTAVFRSTTELSPIQTGAVWIEKTIVKGRADREGGDHALGKALWSPQRSKNGGDIYANMRNVRRGDIVLHLTDNEGFTGASIVTGDLDDTFKGIEDSEWYGDCYRIALGEFETISPSFNREQFLKQPPYSLELKELLEAGAKGLFFNSNLELNQGKYLTEATPTLLSILSRAYHEASGKHLPKISRTIAPESESSTGAEPYSVEDALDSLLLDQAEIENILLIWRAKKNIILQGPPGVGKSFAADKLAFALMGEADPSKVGFVQFHQSYSYEDFVEGFKPVENGFELRSGKFVQFCRRAEEDSKSTYVFIIDEINRGNLSKILGELMLLIECDKRDPGWAISLASGKVPFHVPANVYLMGLMNTADRSLAVVDYALRRRFAFMDLKPKIASEKFNSLLQENGISDRLIQIVNERVLDLNFAIVGDRINLGDGFAIGHSFFCSKPLSLEDDRGWYKRIIKTEIVPLLKEYWFDSPDKAIEWEEILLEGL